MLHAPSMTVRELPEPQVTAVQATLIVEETAKKLRSNSTFFNPHPPESKLPLSPPNNFIGGPFLYQLVLVSVLVSVPVSVAGAGAIVIFVEGPVTETPLYVATTFTSLYVTALAGVQVNVYVPPLPVTVPGKTVAPFLICTVILFPVPAEAVALIVIGDPAVPLVGETPETLMATTVSVFEAFVLTLDESTAWAVTVYTPGSSAFDSDTS